MASSSRGGGDHPDDFVHGVARRLAATRRQRGLSQENLAALLGIAVKNLQRIESGKQNLSLETIDRICKALGVPADSLLGASTREAARDSSSPERPSARPPVLDRLADAGFTVRAAMERGRRPANAVPVTTLRAAAGYLTGAVRATEVIGWTVLSRRGPPPAGQFVAEVRGRSMEPRISSGSICLFERPVSAPFEDRLLLVAHTSMVDDDLGGPYALKQLKTKRVARGREQITLASINPEFAPIVLSPDEDELQIIAELVRVLVTG